MSNEQNISFITYDELLKQLEESQTSNHLLLGNGFNLSLGINTRYTEIFEQMKEDNEDYKSVIVKEKFDIESFIGECKAKISSDDNPNKLFMDKYIHNKIKLDFMRAITHIVAKEVKTIFQERNEKIYLLLKQFNNYFTLNYDPFLYQLLMTYKKDGIKQGLAFNNSFPYIKELMNESDKQLYKTIENAYNTGKLIVSLENKISIVEEFQELIKSEFLTQVKKVLGKQYRKKQLKRVIDVFWQEKIMNRERVLDKVDDGFGLFGDELVYQNPETQNVFFLHGAFHIYKNGKSVYKITQQSERALYQRIEEIVEDGQEKIICIFSDTNKKAEIENEEYLTNGLNKLKDLEGSIVIIGSSLDNNDSHIFTQIQNSKIENVYISSFKKDIKNNFNQAKQWFSEKNVVFFDTETIGYNK